MSDRNYQRPSVPASWADSRETHQAVAVAIHAIASASRSPEAIWDAPTAAEFDHVRMAVGEYIAHGDFDAEDDGIYPWGAERVELKSSRITEITMSNHPNRSRSTSVTYTYPADGRGEAISGLTAREVAEDRLTWDGHEYEMRPEDGGGWAIYVRNPHRQKTFTLAYANDRPLFSLAVTEDDAWDELAPRVVFARGWRAPHALTDADYAKMRADAE